MISSLTVQEHQQDPLHQAAVPLCWDWQKSSRSRREPGNVMSVLCRIKHLMCSVSPVRQPNLELKWNPRVTNALYLQYFSVACKYYLSVWGAKRFSLVLLFHYITLPSLIVSSRFSLWFYFWFLSQWNLRIFCL